jgi:hypothetical protein
VAGGTFLFQNGRTITGNVVMATGGGSLMSLTGSGSSRTIVGNVSSSVSGLGIYVASNSDGLTIVGNVTSTGNGNCINGYDRLFITITGNVSSTSTAHAIQDQTSAGACSISITGDVTSSSTPAAVWVNTGGTITVTGTVTGGTTYGIFSLQALVIQNGNQVDGTNGHRAIHTTRLWISPSVQMQHQIRTNNAGVVGSLRSLYTGGVNLGQPVVANVRSGTVYGAASEYTGTLAVPSPTLVAIGVVTDNTVGSYSPSVNASDIRTAVGLATANLDTQLSGIQADTNDIQTRLPAALESGRIAAVLDSAARVTLAASQPAITFGAVTIDVSGSTPNITLTGSGSGNGIEWTRSGSGDPLDADVVDQIQSGLSTLDASGVRSAVGLASANLDTQLGDIPTVAEFEARSIVAANYATSSALSTVEGKIDTIDNFIDTEVLAIKAVTDKIDTGLVLDGAVYQFTENMLELGPSGGGDATEANQLTIIDKIDNYISTALAGIEFTPGTITGFPATLNVGDSYTDDCNSSISVFIRDADGDPITDVGDHSVTDGDFAPECTITQNGNTGRVKATVTYVTASPEGYLKIQIPSKESRRATAGMATVQVLLKWDNAQKTLSTQAVEWVAQI